MRVIVAVIGNLLLLLIAAFAIFGFLATFEPTDRPEMFMAFRLGYTIIGLACLAASVRLIVRCFRR